VTTLQTVDGRLLRTRQPRAGLVSGSGFFPASFPPMWSNGEREGDPDGHLVSYEGIYRSQPVVGAVVNKLSRRVATLPLDVIRETNGRREVVDGNSLDTLLSKPMPRWGRVHLLSFIETSLLVNGNAVLAKLRTDPDGPPDMLWPLDWSRLTAYGEVGGTIEFWSTTQFENQVRGIEAVDTIHFAWPGPDGGEIGVSPLEQLGTTIKLDDATQRHSTSLYERGIRPSAVVTLEDPNAKSDKLEQAAATVRAAHAGKPGQWVWMGAGTKVTPLQLTPVEAGLSEQRQRSWEEVAAVYDMAGPLSGDLTHGTYSNVQVILDSLYRDVVPPWTTLIVETLQSQLIDPEPAWLGLSARFDFTDKLRGDPAAAALADKSDVEAGIRTRDEVRTVRGLPPEGGSAAQLSANLNNQAPVSSMGTEAAQ
jgi:HK97 family phage portal protein